MTSVTINYKGKDVDVDVEGMIVRYHMLLDYMEFVALNSVDKGVQLSAAYIINVMTGTFKAEEWREWIKVKKEA